MPNLTLGYSIIFMNKTPKNTRNTLYLLVNKKSQHIYSMLQSREEIIK
jgi:hypothetical protein